MEPAMDSSKKQQKLLLRLVENEWLNFLLFIIYNQKVFFKKQTEYFS